MSVKILPFGTFFHANGPDVQALRAWVRGANKIENGVVARAGSRQSVGERTGGCCLWATLLKICKIIA